MEEEIKKIKKPLSVRIVDFRKSIISSINEAELPACVVREVMIPLMTEIERNAMVEYENDLKKYNEEEQQRKEV